MKCNYSVEDELHVSLFEGARFVKLLKACIWWNVAIRYVIHIRDGMRESNAS